MAILILLAGIVYVLTGSSREASRRTQCMNNLRQIAIATYQYMIDYQALYDDPPRLASIPAGLQPFRSILEKMDTSRQKEVMSMRTGVVSIVYTGSRKKPCKEEYC